MNDANLSLTDLETDLKYLTKTHLQDFNTHLNFKKGNENTQNRLKLFSKIPEKLANEVVNKSIDFIRKNKITDSSMINKVVRLNQKYIRDFKKLVQK